MKMPQKEKLRSVVLGAEVVLATTVDYDAVAMSHVFQDDVKVVAVYLGIEFLALDAHSNTDGMFNGLVELSRQGARSQPGTMGRLATHGVWNALVSIGGETRKSLYCPCPGDTGWEIDEGESVNLLALAEWVGTGGDMKFYPEAIVYYTER